MLRESIKRYRTYSTITQKRMAELLGISVSKYLRKENGLYRFNRDEVILIAKILKLDERKLMIYWIADNIYKFLHNDIELTDDVIKFIKSHLDDYESDFTK